MLATVCWANISRAAATLRGRISKAAERRDLFMMIFVLVSIKRDQTSAWKQTQLNIHKHL